MSKFAVYEAPTRCTGSSGPGARALMSVILGIYPDAKNWGIYNCRNTALGNKSAHSEGRALDIGCSVPIGRRIVGLLMKVGPEKLGVTVIIHDRVIFSARAPGGRRYSGHPHQDHVHIEMTRKSAAEMSVATAKRILNPSDVDLSQVIEHARKHGEYTLRVAAALRAEGFTPDLEGYRSWQRKLGYSGGDADGIAGEKSLRALGKKHGWAVTP